MAKTQNDKQALTPEAAADRLEAIYAGSCAALSRALDRYLATRKPPTAKDRSSFRYPLLRVTCRHVGAAARTRRAYAKFQRPGVYATTVTHPRHFRRYLLEQLEPLVTEYGAHVVECGDRRRVDTRGTERIGDAAEQPCRLACGR